MFRAVRTQCQHRWSGSAAGHEDKDLERRSGPLLTFPVAPVLV